MIIYSHEDWIGKRLFSCSGSVLPAASRWAFLGAACAAGLSYLFERTGVLDDLNDRLDGLGIIWSGFTAILGLLVAFRNNVAYARFWEGATLVNQMRGEWFNATSSLLAFCGSDPAVEQDVVLFQHLLVRLVSILHCSALQNICEVDESSLEILDTHGIDERSLLHLETAHDKCEVLVHWLQRLIIKAHRDGVIVADPPILSRCFQELSRGTVNLHNVRKIRDIPQPFPYTQVLLCALVLHSVLTPLIAASCIHHPAVAGLLCFLVTCLIWSIVYIADQIDQPFGEDPNDLPSTEMQNDFNASLLGLMHPSVLRVPHFNPITTQEQLVLTTFGDRWSNIAPPSDEQLQHVSTQSIQRFGTKKPHRFSMCASHLDGSHASGRESQSLGGSRISTSSRISTRSHTETDAQDAYPESHASGTRLMGFDAMPTVADQHPDYTQACRHGEREISRTAPSNEDAADIPHRQQAESCENANIAESSVNSKASSSELQGPPPHQNDGLIHAVV